MYVVFFWLRGFEMVWTWIHVYVANHRSIEQIASTSYCTGGVDNHFKFIPLSGSYLWVAFAGRDGEGC